MKIAYFDLYLPYVYQDEDYPAGGAANEWKNWIDGLLANNCKVGLITFKGAKDIINDGPKIDIIETYELSNIKSLKKSILNFIDLYKSIRKYNPDYIVQEVAGTPTGILGILSFLLSIKYIYRVANDIDVDERINERLNIKQKILFKIGLKLANVFVCQNEYQYQMLKAKYPRKKITKIFNPINTNVENIKKSTFENKSYYAWIGLFSKQKNLKDLFKIASKSLNSTFCIAGKSISLDDETSEYVNKLKELPNVKFVGFLKRSDILEFLSNAIALINTSLYEGFSNTFLEAWKAGVPVISTIRVNPDNLITAHDLGYVCSDVDEQIVKIDYLEKNKMQLLKHFNNKCKNYVIENHDSRIIAHKLMEYLTNLPE